MSKISLIPENINRYAIEWARKICNEPIEYAKCLDFQGDKIIKESELISGENNKVFYNFSKGNPKDIICHNHPAFLHLSIEDICLAVNKNVQKIFASTMSGFTSMDLTTANKPLAEINNWLINAKKDYENTINALKNTSFSQNGGFTPRVKRILIFNDFTNTKLTEFSKFSGAIFEKTKWTDLK